MDPQAAVTLTLVEVVGLEAVEGDATGLDELDGNEVASSILPIPVGTAPAITREQKNHCLRKCSCCCCV